MNRDERTDTQFEQILLLGCDVDQDKLAQQTATAEDKCQRSDAIIVLLVDRVNNIIKIISIMRDVYVPVPGYGMKRLNEVVMYGGPELSMQVINDCFDFQIKKYARVTIRGMIDLIDMFGGVDVCLSKEEMDYINGWLPEAVLIGEWKDDIPPIPCEGWNHLSGIQTMVHVRNRTIGYMVGRENRINDVLKSMADKARKEMSLTECLSYAMNARKYINTNMNIVDVVKLLRVVYKVDPATIETYHAPEEGTYEVARDHEWRLEVDYEKANWFLWDFIKNKQD